MTTLREISRTPVTSDKVTYEAINAAINIREAGMAILAGAEMLRTHEKSTAGLAGI